MDAGRDKQRALLGDEARRVFETFPALAREIDKLATATNNLVGELQRKQETSPSQERLERLIKLRSITVHLEEIKADLRSAGVDLIFSDLWNLSCSVQQRLRDLNIVVLVHATLEIADAHKSKIE